MELEETVRLTIRGCSVTRGIISTFIVDNFYEYVLYKSFSNFNSIVIRYNYHNIGSKI